MRYHYDAISNGVTPEMAIEILKSGNERFINNIRINRDLLQLVNATAAEQSPFACILSCSDSRVPAELIFDQGLGDIFSIRLAGNIASVNAIGSIEYACKVLRSKLVVVMGHTNCGAIKGACMGLDLGNLNELLKHIHPAIAANGKAYLEYCDDKEYLDSLALTNVHYQITVILDKSEIIRSLIDQNEVALMGAIYNVETGKVNFYDDYLNLLKNENLAAIEG
ncbi:MAG: carbonic anhydrase [Flavisolibacter sp.]|nr:carbonic anhydrase [Flavisolibacter sp.]